MLNWLLSSKPNGAGASDALTKPETIKPGLSLKVYRAFTSLAAPFAPLMNRFSPFGK